MTEKDWKNFLKYASQGMKVSLANRLNNASDEVVRQMKSNMEKVGIHEDTGRLRGSIRIKKATPATLKCYIVSEVYAARPKKPNWNRHLWKKKGWYMNGLNLSKDLHYPASGTPYGRLLEFSPRLNKPFFYKSWYEKQQYVKESMVDCLKQYWRTVTKELAG